MVHGPDGEQIKELQRGALDNNKGGEMQGNSRNETWAHSARTTMENLVSLKRHGKKKNERRLRGVHRCEKRAKRRIDRWEVPCRKDKCGV